MWGALRQDPYGPYPIHQELPPPSISPAHDARLVSSGAATSTPNARKTKFGVTKREPSGDWVLDFPDAGRVAIGEGLVKGEERLGRAIASNYLRDDFGIIQIPWRGSCHRRRRDRYAIHPGALLQLKAKV